MKPIFLNNNTYPVQVGTPSGTGRTLQPGDAAEGDYFSGPVSRGMPLRRLTKEEAIAFNKRNIVISLDSNTSGVQAEVARPYAETSVSENKQVAPDAVNKTMEESLDQAMKEMGTQIPTLAELKKLDIQQLNVLAVKHNISKASGRADIINQLKDKLAL